ncbi:hypothetical protein QFC22_000957 [Naganishia vaughanmartiniae]|uniref:Uncharacterized protein n=1 Tax=Naganishia vaughanmartiniae TaxID=1424756 RepID=A0ACC2XKM0_9TREE|nr:hypothetical protein QFC22_000957 [Naganishia vaughanmartiniae]
MSPILFRLLSLLESPAKYKMVSVSAQTTTSPLCRSPLSQSSFPRRATNTAVLPIPDSTVSSKRDRQQQRQVSASTSSDEDQDHAPPARRPSTTTIALSPRRLSTSRSLAGSYTLSLLSSRMSAAHPTHHVPSAFTLKLSSVSPGRGVPSGLKCPEHVKIAFDARWYALDSSSSGSPSSTGGAAWTPWVGNVDVEEYYARQFRTTYPSPHAQCVATGRKTSRPPRPRPGYQLGPGGRLLYKERAYQMLPSITEDPPSNKTEGKAGPAGREVLKYAIELQFLCVAKKRKISKYPATQTDDASLPTTTDKKRKRHTAAAAAAAAAPDSASHQPENPHSSASYYLGKQIRLVFPTNSSALHPTDGPLAVSSPQATATTTTIPARRHHPSSVPAAPSIRIERLIEVQSPPPPPPSSILPAQTAVQTLPSPPVSTKTTTESRPIGKTHNSTTAVAQQRRDSARVSFSGSLTSESWDGLRARWDMQAERLAAAAASTPTLASASSVDAQPEESKSGDEVRETAPGKGSLGLNGKHQYHHHTTKAITTTAQNKVGHRSPNATSTTLPPPATSSSSLVFTRSPTPVIGGLSLLKSPSLLTARLEEMSASGSFTSSPPLAHPSALAEEQQGTEHHDGQRIGGVNGTGGVDSARASGAGRRRKASLWPALGAGDEDHERLLSESLQKLPISYHR